MADAYPVTQPRTFGGYELSDNPARMGDIERGFFATAWDNARAYWELETMERWRALFEDAPEISQDEFDEMVGDRPIEKRPFQTVAETERAIAIHDWEQSQQEYEKRGIASFVGTALPLMLDPVSVATMPVGWQNFARAAGAKTMRQALLQSSIGGAKVGAATVPLEVGMQMRTRGEVDPMTVAAAGVGPAALSPMLAAAGRGARAAFRRSPDNTLADAANRSKIKRPEAAPEDVAKAVHDHPDARPPAPYVRESEALTPTMRLNEAFERYDGGSVRWVQDMAAQDPRAVQFARDLGIDPEASTVLRDFMREVKSASDAVAGTPTRVNMDLARAFHKLDRGEPLTVREANGLRVVGLIERAEGPPASRFADISTLRETRPYRRTVLGERLAKAIEAPQVPANRALLDDFYARGAGAIKDRLARETGDPDAVQDLASVIAPIDEPNRLMNVLEAARAETRGKPDPAAGRTTPEVEQHSPEVQSSFAREADSARQQLLDLGSDDEDVRALARAMMEGLEVCRV